MRKVLDINQKRSIRKCYFALKSASAENSNPDTSEMSIYNTVSNIFDVHESTIRRIVREDDKEFPKNGRPKNTMTAEEFVFRKDLQGQIWNYNSKNEHFGIDTLLNYAKDNLEYEGGRTSLFKILKSMGYKYKIVNERQILCEQKHVVAAKITFLRKYLQYKSLGENIRFVLLDETWIYQNGSSVRRWAHESDIKSNTSKIKSEGKRFTVLHAGSNFGFLEGCSLILDSKINDRDYHKTMTSEIFQNWVGNQLIPALAKIPGKCVVVMDNAPYHSVQLDDLLKEHGHEVLRLPPFHCQYNPIEMAWAFSKNFYNKNINSLPYSKDRVLNLWTLALSNCTTEMWKIFCLHCDRTITDDWTKRMGNLPIANIPPFIISLGESDSEFSDVESDSINDSMDVE